MARTTEAGSRRGADRGGHRGNKATLPAKPCAACGRPMSWRRRWAAVWDEVRYCSERCRRQPRTGRP